MAFVHLRTGDRLCCSNPQCRLEVAVTDIGTNRQSTTLLQCWCGFPMRRAYQKPTLTKVPLNQNGEAER